MSVTPFWCRYYLSLLLSYTYPFFFVDFEQVKFCWDTVYEILCKQNLKKAHHDQKNQKKFNHSIVINFFIYNIRPYSYVASLLRTEFNW